ncbi:DUF551 domain-containing protein [Ochrobactrum pseudogrignonense]|nr:DUF551 domain-containing protein [Brucella pseudogrignonensis]
MAPGTAMAIDCIRPRKAGEQGFFTQGLRLSGPIPRAQALEEAAKIAFDVSENGEYMGNGDCSGNSIFQQGARYVYDEICEEIRALSSQPVADGWLPIETAPKDGTPFLVFVPDDQFSDGTGIDVIWYDEERWLFGSNTPFIPANDPTHWRLLPASPGASE